MKSSNNISRNDFLKNSALAAASLALSSNVVSATAIFNDRTPSLSDKLTLKNVRLETGFEYDGNDVVNTKTYLFYIEIENGKISKIAPNQPNAKAVDAKGLLMLPAFRDMHIHLDKTYYGDKRHDCFRTANTP
jgi:hypothetical protein